MDVLFILIFLVIPFYLLLWLVQAKRQVLGPSPITNAPSISIVIPFRNEVKHLPGLIEDLLHLQVIDGDEFILIDDQSTDSGQTLVPNSDSRFKLILLPENQVGSKKRALEAGIHQAKNELILTLDADCRILPDWLNSRRQAIQDGIAMIAATVETVSSKISLRSWLVGSEQIALQTITRASMKEQLALMNNGANLLFRKSVWLKLGGYQSNSGYASGDDVFLLRDMLLHKHRVEFDDQMSSSVSTNTPISWSEWMSQRLRWASKSSHVHGTQSQWIAFAFLVWLFSFIPGLIIYGPMYLLMLLPELIILKVISPIKASITTLVLWPFFRLIYPFSVLAIVLGSLVLKPRWKGRSIKVSK